MNYVFTAIVVLGLFVVSGCRESGSAKKSPPPNPPTAKDLEQVHTLNQTTPAKPPGNR